MNYQGNKMTLVLTFHLSWVFHAHSSHRKELQRKMGRTEGRMRKEDILGTQERRDGEQHFLLHCEE